MTAMQSISDLRGYLRNPENNDLYVVNKSHLGGQRKRSECILTVLSGGQNVHIVVKDTYIPQNIGLKVSSLLDYAKSEDFQRYVTLGFLQPIDPESAETYLKTSEARDEMARLNGVEVSDDLSTGSVEVVKSRTLSANPKVVAIMMNDMETGRKIAALKNIASEITSDDIKYIIQNSKDERVKSWAVGFKQ